MFSALSCYAGQAMGILKTAVLEGSIDGATCITRGTLEYPTGKTVQGQTLKIEKGVRPGT
jgi:hypothetical protein